VLARELGGGAVVQMTSARRPFTLNYPVTSRQRALLTRGLLRAFPAMKCVPTAADLVKAMRAKAFLWMTTKAAK
jgi:hypothetical protein